MVESSSPMASLAMVLTSTAAVWLNGTEDVGNGSEAVEVKPASGSLVTSAGHQITDVSTESAVIITLLYTIIFVTGVVGNVCTCVVISRNKYMHTATNFYLFSLAISDLLLLVLGLPQEMYLIWVPLPYVFGETFCVIRGLAAEMSTNASILTITAFTIERYLAICHPLRSHTMSKLSRAVKLILVIWVVAALCAVPQAIQFGIVLHKDENDSYIPGTEDCLLKAPLDKAFELSTLFFFFLPMCLLTVLYVLIGLRLRNPGFRTPSTSTRSKNGFQDSRRNGSTSSRNQQPSSGHGSRRNHHERLTPTLSSSSGNSRRAVIKMLVAVVVAFFICWAPFHAQRLMAIYSAQDPPQLIIKVFEALTFASGVLYYVSATINPILYHIMSFKFRTAFKETLGSCCGRRPSRTTKSSSLYNFNSTVRSRVMTENTETTLETLLREEDAADDGYANGGTKRPSPPTQGGCAIPARRSVRSTSEKPANPSQPSSASVTISAVERHCRPGGSGATVGNCTDGVNSNSVSSMQMVEDDLVSPKVVTSFMTEISESGDAVPAKLDSTQDSGQNGNGYFISRC